MLSRLHRASAPLMLVVWLAGLLLPVVGPAHGVGADDPACERPLWLANHRGAQLEKDSQSGSHGHCGVCHLQRAVRGALHTVVCDVAHVDAGNLRPGTQEIARQISTFDVTSSRAPPTTLLSAIS